MQLKAGEIIRQLNAFAVEGQVFLTAGVGLKPVFFELMTWLKTYVLAFAAVLFSWTWALLQEFPRTPPSLAKSRSHIPWVSTRLSRHCSKNHGILQITSL